MTCRTCGRKRGHLDACPHAPRPCTVCGRGRQIRGPVCSHCKPRRLWDCTCRVCGKPFQSAHRKAVTCGTACRGLYVTRLRQAGHRERVRQEFPGGYRWVVLYAKRNWWGDLTRYVHRECETPAEAARAAAAFEKFNPAVFVERWGTRPRGERVNWRAVLAGGAGKCPLA